MASVFGRTAPMTAWIARSSPRSFQFTEAPDRERRDAVMETVPRPCGSKPRSVVAIVKSRPNARPSIDSARAP